MKPWTSYTVKNMVPNVIRHQTPMISITGQQFFLITPVTISPSTNPNNDPVLNLSFCTPNYISATWSSENEQKDVQNQPQESTHNVEYYSPNRDTNGGSLSPPTNNTSVNQKFISEDPLKDFNNIRIPTLQVPTVTRRKDRGQKRKRNTKKLENTNENGDSTGEVTPKRSKRGRKPIDKSKFYCHECSVTKSCEWRRGPDGKNTLCNACGLQHSKRLKNERLNKVNKGSISFILNHNK